MTKTSFRTAIERRFQKAGGVLVAQATVEEIAPVPSPENFSQPLTGVPYQDWGDAIDVSFFCGRETEREQLKRWILNDRCRLIAVLGMGGIGKTSLVVKVVQEIVRRGEGESEGGFEFIIWRSFRNAPPLDEVLTDLLNRLSAPSEPSPESEPADLTHHLRDPSDLENSPRSTDPQSPESVMGKLSRFLSIVRSRRCLIVFDNVETLFQANSSGDARLQLRSQPYRAGYEPYGELFKQLGETVHASCFLLTSREKPQSVALLEGERLPVRSIALKGLPQRAGQEIIKLKGSFEGTEIEWEELISGYSGNPLALKIISTTIQTLFNGRLSVFLQQNTFVFGDIHRLIAQQFSSLSNIEKIILYWLAIYREPETFTTLQADLFPTISPQVLMETLEILERRSLIEKNSSAFSLQPVVLEYITNEFTEQVCREITTALTSSSSINSLQNPLLKSHALLKTQSADYILESQSRFILQPILDRLRKDFIHPAQLEEKLLQLLTELRHKPALEVGYGAGNLLNLRCHLHPHLQGYDFSGLSFWQANLQNVTLRDINFEAADLRHSTFAETLGIVFCVAFSPDGHYLATGDAEGGLRLWQVDQGQLLLDFAGHRGWVWSIAFSADGQRLASCSSDKTIRIWEVQTGQCLQTLRGHQSSVWSIAFSADGEILASGGDEPMIRLWNTHTGEYLKSLNGHHGRVLTLKFDRASQQLASGSDDHTIKLWNIDTGEWIQTLVGHTNRIWSVDFCADGQTLASGSADHSIKLWNTKSGECIRTLQEHTSRVRSVVIGADPFTLISGSDDHTIRIWNIATGECLNTLRGHTNSIFSVSFNANQHLIASGSADQTVRFWHATTAQRLKTLKGYTNSIFSVQISVDGQTLASGSTDQTIRLWNLDSGQCDRILQGHTGWVTSVAFHPQEMLLASSSVDQTVRIWSTRSGHCLNVLRGHSNWVQSVCFSPEGQWLASAGDDRTIRLWATDTGKLLKTLEGHAGWIWSIAFHPNREYLASSSEDQTIRLWSVQDGRCLQILEGHTGRVQSIAFSSDGQWLASASNDETVRLWNIETGECDRILLGHENNVWAVAFSPDGTQLASGSLDQTVRLWDIPTGQCIRILPVLNHSVRSSIAFSPASHPATILATGSHNGVIQLWNSDGECLTQLIPDRPYTGTNITHVTGITAAQKAALKALGAVEA
ncbi:WD40 domain-containing protein [Egbenema bharatensis]|uniref:WD40 domain-containing protein n=1 Tax=Egbenema bharatensis TaxID=3463334 RepID=UPI003A8C4C5C